MSKLFLFTLFFLSTGIPISTSQDNKQQPNEKEYVVKLGLIGLLVDQIVWAPNAHFQEKGSPFTFGIYGESHPFGESLNVFLQEKKFKDRDIKVRLYPNQDDVVNNPPDLLFVPKEFSSKIGQLSIDLANLPVLLIGDEEDATDRGAFIAIFLKNEQVKFKLNLPQFRNKGFVASEGLQRAAVKQP